MKRIRKECIVTKPSCDYFGENIVKEITQKGLIQELSKYLITENIIDIKESKVRYPYNKQIPSNQISSNDIPFYNAPDDRKYSMDLYVMKPEEFKDIIECLLEIFNHNFNYDIDNQIKKIYNILYSDNEEK